MEETTTMPRLKNSQEIHIEVSGILSAITVAVVADILKEKLPFKYFKIIAMLSDSNKKSNIAAGFRNKVENVIIQKP